ncbi:MAG: DUF308 domain-containing protein [Defluviitaleaceae bacterium]|nr:DUF308 domain-containing protein [Defluviitaleaceae bacterium]
MKNILKWLLLLAGLGIIALGIIALLNPLDFLVTMATFFGIAILASGLAEIISHVIEKKENRTGLVLASGILTALFGAWVTFGWGSDIIALVLPFIFASWVMASGVMRIVGAFPQKSKDSENPENSKIKIWQLAFGILATLFGFMLLLHPIRSAAIVTFFIAFTLISQGIGTVVLFFSLKKLEKQTPNK